MPPFLVSLDQYRHDRQPADRPLFNPDGRAFSHEQAQTIREALRWLTAFERDVLDQILRAKKQVEVGRMFGITQQAISYRVKTALKRLQARLALEPAPSLDPVADRLTPEQRQMLELIAEGTNQSVAEALGIPRTRGCAHLIAAAVTRLGDTVEGLYCQRVAALAATEPRYCWRRGQCHEAA